MGAHTKLRDTVPESRPLGRGRRRWAAFVVSATIAVEGLATHGAAGWAQARAQGFGAGSDAPEIASGFRQSHVVRARELMAVTAHPVATEAAYRILNDGGTVVDAAVAAQMVLNVVEPQSSGVGGGGFMLYYHGGTGRIRAYDGREVAPAAAWGDYLRQAEPDSGRPVLPDSRRSGRSVGVPGLVAMLEMAHRRHGARPWSSLFLPAIALALDGFPVSPRMAASIAASADDLRRDPDAAAYFFTPTGAPLPVGWRLYSPVLAQSLARIAAHGSGGFYQGELARAIVEQVSAPPAGATPGKLTLDDLEGYEAIERTVVCSPYREWEVCGFPPPSSGGFTVAQMLGILEAFNLPALSPRQTANGTIIPSPEAVHLITEAGRLAFADRNDYIADPGFAMEPVPSVRLLLEPGYLSRRSALIDPQASMGKALPGLPRVPRAADAGLGRKETTHLSLVDKYGNALAMTTSLEGGFGSYMMVDGFLLNNQLTDFHDVPINEFGRVYANRVEGGKRPRSSMAPTLVFERGAEGERGRLVLVTGSPGGAAIIHYVVNHLVALLDWGLSPSEAMAMGHFGAFNDPRSILETNEILLPEGWPASVVEKLKRTGHEVAFEPRTSGLATIMLSPPELVRPLSAAADPRREGVAQGD
ncbi:MAG: gamma-glutamyltransferase family protein [Pigmentiphaga sp.]